MNGEVTCCLMLSMILVDLIAAGQLGGWLVGKRYRVGRCRWYWKVHSSSSSSFFTPIQAPTKCSFGSQHKDTKKFGSRRVIQSFSPKLAILVYWDKWWHTLSEALVHSQGSWLAPRGLGWLPEVLVGSQGSCLAPRSFGAATHCGSLMATFSLSHFNTINVVFFPSPSPVYCSHIDCPPYSLRCFCQRLKTSTLTRWQVSYLKGFSGKAPLLIICWRKS